MDFWKIIPADQEKVDFFRESCKIGKAVKTAEMRMK